MKCFTYFTKCNAFTLQLEKQIAIRLQPEIHRFEILKWQQKTQHRVQQVNNRKINSLSQALSTCLVIQYCKYV